jgi:Xaa-Pro dipeptidase
VLFNEPRARKLLEGNGLDAVVVALPVSVAYLTGHESSFESGFRNYMFAPGGDYGRLFRSFAVVAASGERALVTHAALAAHSYTQWEGGLEVYAGASVGAEVVEQVPAELRHLARGLAKPRAEHPIEAVAEAVRSLVPTARRVGVEVGGLEPGDADALVRALPNVELPNASTVMRLIRMVKTDDEIERSTRAAVITEDALRHCVEAARPGLSTDELVARFRSACAAKGADLEHVAVGPRGLGIATGGGHRLERGEVTILDVGCRFRSCVSDTGVTLVVGAADDEIVEEYRVLNATLEAGGARLAPGVSVVSVYDAMRAVADGTVAAACLPVGHGLGQEPRELPYVAPVGGLRLVDDCVDLDADVALEAGMVINLEIPLDVPGRRSFQVERSFVVTDGGARPICAQDRSQLAKAGASG